MKIQYAIVIGAILVGSLATVNWAFVSETDASANTLKSSAGILGHVTLTAMNEDGNVISYRQTDNVVINAGDNCILDDVFGTNVGGCDSLTNPYVTVHIGTDSVQAFGETATDLVTYHAQTTGVTGSSTAASVTGGAGTTVTAAFFDVNANIAEAALKNSSVSASADVLALQKFTPISLGTTDDLTIEWTVTIDGN